MSSRKILVAALVFLLAGCIGPKTDGLLATGGIPVPVNEIAGNHSIFVATTRERADEANRVFDGGRSARLNFARVAVTVPLAHKTGAIELKEKAIRTIRRNSSPRPTSSPMAASRNSRRR